MLPIPCAYLALAITLGLISPELDRAVGGHVNLGVGPDAARDVLTSTATGMIAFTGLVVSSVLLAVQFAAGQYSPRLVLWFRQDQVVKHTIGSFLAAPLFALVALREIERRPLSYSPDITVVVTLLLLVGAALLFLALLQRVLDRLRPRSVYGAVARDGIRAARVVYPLPFDHPEPAVDGRAPWRDEHPCEVTLEHATGVVTSFDTMVLVAAAAEADVIIELAPGIGEFVARGQPLLRVHGRGPVDERLLRSAVTIADKRTIEQDPAYAIRIIVDTAIRALSAAINDPTTATQGIDALEALMRALAGRNLEASFALDDHGATRLVWRTPGWSDLLDLAFNEILYYGARSVQVTRRLRAALEDLRSSTPLERHDAIDTHLGWLDETMRRTVAPGSAEEAIAAQADRVGLGLARCT
jgi:uncharacterized membrane protein